MAAQLILHLLLLLPLALAQPYSLSMQSCLCKSWRACFTLDMQWPGHSSDAMLQDTVTACFKPRGPCHCPGKIREGLGQPGRESHSRPLATAVTAAIGSLRLQRVCWPVVDHCQAGKVPIFLNCWATNLNIFSSPNLPVQDSFDRIFDHLKRQNHLTVTKE